MEGVDQVSAFFGINRSIDAEVLLVSPPATKFMFANIVWQIELELLVRNKRAKLDAEKDEGTFNVNDYFHLHRSSLENSIFPQ